MGQINIFRTTVFILMTTVIALSFHVVLLQCFHLPPPEKLPDDGWVSFVILVGKIIGAFGIYRAGIQFFRKGNGFKCFLLLLAVLLMLDEQLIRVPLMTMLVSKTVLYSLSQSVPHYINAIVLALGVMGIDYSLKNARYRWLTGAGMIVVVFAALYTLKPFITETSHFLQMQAPQPDQSKVLMPPYGLSILIPAYITYLSPVCACFIVFNAGSQGHYWNNNGSVKAAFAFCVSLLLFKGILIATLVYPAFSDQSLFIALLSPGQFFLEILMLGLLTTCFIRSNARVVANNS